MRVLQINVTVNTGSTGRIAENIGLALLSNGDESIIAYGRKGPDSASQTILIGSKLDQQLHGLKTRFFDQHGFGSEKATQKLIEKICEIKPDLIHLHNLHGYYLNIGVLFAYLKDHDIPVVWTLHDCWSFTGHCSHFMYVGCEKWKTQCHRCPLFNRYPKSYVDNSFHNYVIKKELFSGVKNMTLVSPSNWLKALLPQSFLKEYPSIVINNGVDINTFKPDTIAANTLKEKLGLASKNVLLGVASVWDRGKGYKDFLELSNVIDQDDIIVLVGLPKSLTKNLPKNVVGLPRTENIKELVALYNIATVFINPTRIDNFPTTNLEALACGTPVITYRTGGSAESINANTGFLVEQGDINNTAVAIKQIKANTKEYYLPFCRNRAVDFFNEQDRFLDYYNLYKNLLLRL